MKINKVLMMEEDNKEKQQESQMPFTEHLEELRRRLFIIIGSVTAFALIAYFFSEKLLEIILVPAPEDVSLISLKPAQLFFVHIKLAFFAGIIVSIPVIVFQIWQFVAPGLFPNERRYIAPIIFFTVLCFVGGAMFSYSIVTPYGLIFFQSFETSQVTAQWSIDEYISFVTMMTMVFGIVFELPILCTFLGKIGLINHKMMSKYRRYAILGCFILGAVLTPPDGYSQVALAIPLAILYEVSIILVRIVGKKDDEEDK